jgi:hypothetical protein
MIDINVRKLLLFKTCSGVKILSEEGKNIKTYSNYLIAFVILNIFLYLLLTYGIQFIFGMLNEPYITTIIKSGIIVTILGVITFVLNGLLTSNIKYMLVFWKRKDYLPGCRIFTNSFDHDPRINKSALIKKYGVLPIKPNEQNNLCTIFIKNISIMT